MTEYEDRILLREANGLAVVLCGAKKLFREKGDRIRRSLFPVERELLNDGADTRTTPPRNKMKRDPRRFQALKLILKERPQVRFAIGVSGQAEKICTEQRPGGKQKTSKINILPLCIDLCTQVRLNFAHGDNYPG